MRKNDFLGKRGAGTSMVQGDAQATEPSSSSNVSTKETEAIHFSEAIWIH